MEQTAGALQEEWGITAPDVISEEAIMQKLEERVFNLMQQGSDAFYSLMYRLDISEKKLNIVIGSEDAPRRIARLIFDRQLQKAKSRMEHRQTLDDWDSEEYRF